MPSFQVFPLVFFILGWLLSEGVLPGVLSDAVASLEVRVSEPQGEFHRLLTEVMEKLPAQLKKDLDVSILIEREGPQQNRITLQRSSYGRWERDPKRGPKTNRLKIRPEVWDLVESRQSRNIQESVHGTFYRSVQAYLVREIAEYYDYLGPTLEDEFLKRHYCESKKQSGACQEWSAHRLRISDHPQYMAQAGFFRPNEKSMFLDWDGDSANGDSANGDSEGSTREVEIKKLDPRFLKSSSDHFKASMEYYILDPKFVCVQPGTYTFLKNHFSDHRQDGDDRKGERLFSICQEDWISPFDGRDPRDWIYKAEDSRVYRVDLTYIEAGGPVEEWWGHLEYRVAVCGLGRSEVNQECLADLDFHFLLGFYSEEIARGVALSDAFSGKVPSYLVLRDYRQVVIDNQRGKERDLYTYPILFSRSELNQFLASAFQYVRTFRGSWHHLKRNCVSQAFMLLRASVKESLENPLSEVEHFIPATLIRQLREKTHLISRGEKVPRL